MNKMPEFSDIISQVYADNKTETDIKKETLQILYDAQGIISFAERNWKWDEVRKQYESIKNKTIDAVKDWSEITKEELNELKKQIEDTNEKMSEFYIKNPDMLVMETNKNIVIKTLKKLVQAKKENINTLTDIAELTVDVNRINPALREDINVLEVTRKEWIGLFAEDIQKIPLNFFKNENNVEKLLDISNQHSLIILIASKNIKEDNLINLIWKINKKNSRYIIQEMYIPIDLLNKDTNNLMFLDPKWKKSHLKKIDEITEDSIDKMLNNNEKKIDDLAHEVEYYLNKYTLNDLSDKNIEKILTELLKTGTLNYAPKFLFGLNNKIGIVSNFITKNDESFIKVLPFDIIKNNEVQIAIIDTIGKNIKNNKKYDLLLDHLEIDDIEIAKYFYKTIKNLWIEKSNEIFSDYTLREKFGRILWDKNISNDVWNKDMIDEFSFRDKWWKDLLNAVKSNKIIIDKIKESKSSQEIFTKSIKDKLKLKESDTKINELVTKVLDLTDDELWTNKSKLLFDEISKICWSPEKATDFIKEVKDYQIAKSVEKTDNIVKDLNDKKFDKFNVKLDEIQKNFEDFLVNKIQDFKEKNKDKPDINALSKEAIEEYIKNNKKEWISPEDEAKIREILTTFVARRQTKSERDNIVDYTKTMSWEMKKEDYDKVMQKSLEQKYDFKAEKAIVEKNLQIQNNTFIPTEDNYSKVEWWYNLIWKNWEPIKWLVISEQEKKITLWNPEATKNLINFYDFFKELNLEWVWKYRNELMIAIWDIYIDQNDADSMKTEELRKFWNKILTFITNAWKENKEWENQKINLSSIQSVNQELQKFSWTNSPLNDKKTFNSYWEDRFTTFLRQQWIIWWAYFKINEFRKYL